MSRSAQSVEQPLRSELLSIDLLRQHAGVLARAHRVAECHDADRLLPRLAANERVLRSYNEQTQRVEKARRITPAAEWLLDNFYLIEDQIHTARRHLPRGFCQELPHLADGPSARLPRAYDLALELISHVDGRLDATHLTAFIASYLEVTPLKLGELWAIPIMLRLALIENLRRIAVMLTEERQERDLADAWAARWAEGCEDKPTRLIIAVAEFAKTELSLSRPFVTQLWQRLQETPSQVKLALGWIEERLAEEGMTIEGLVQGESQSQAANQVSVGNSILSLRFLEAMNWPEFVETLSVVEQTLRSDPARVYSDMDFATRDAYRHVVERVARGSRRQEWDVAQLAITLARAHVDGEDVRPAHVGYYLVGDGVAALERAAGMAAPLSLRLSRFARRFPLGCYLGSIAATSAAVASAVLRLGAWSPAPAWVLGLAGLLLVLVATQFAVALVNWFITLVVKPRLLPRLDFTEGIPAGCHTLVVVPTLLTSLTGVDRLLEALEVRYLGNRDKHLDFGLLTDFCDAPQERLPGDEALLSRAREGTRRLNAKYQREDSSSIFHLLHRPRRWNEQEQVWMGYERKRGKLSDLNAYLRGGAPDSFSEVLGDFASLPHIKYVITLDTDTQLPPASARELVGTMAHPLNGPVYDPRQGRVVEGYAILQPRVAVSLPSAGRSRFAKLFAGDPGIDPYTRAVSDVYQDLFHEGSFIGKGIYDVDAFAQAVGGKLPENRILSHDLLEGCYARSALATDVQLFEDCPAHYLADARRRHRWIRGDWQIAAWLLPRVPGPGGQRVRNPLSLLARWKLLDNLRRSLVPGALVGLLVFVCATSGATGPRLIWWLLAFLWMPGALASLTELIRKPEELPVRAHLRNLADPAVRHLGQAFLTLVFLPFEGCVCLDAIGRALVRLLWTRRRLLEWQTARETEKRTGTDLKSHFLAMWPAPALALAAGGGFAMLRPEAGPGALPLLALWAAAPLVAWLISQPLQRSLQALSEESTLFLRQVARRTWRYFETYVGPDDNWLPPDNIQEKPHHMIATRTSPTNMGMALLSTLAAWDLHYVSTPQLTRRLARTLEAMEKLERYRGHFYNWYETRSLMPLPPRYISTVDNGNLAALLLTLQAGLLELTAHPWPPATFLAGLRDTLRELIAAARERPPSRQAQIRLRLEPLEHRLSDPPQARPAQVQLLHEALEEVAGIAEPPRPETDDELGWWRRAFEKQCREGLEDLETAFPWLRRDANFAALAGAQETWIPAQVREIWQHLNTVSSVRELEVLLGRIDGHLEASSSDCPEATALLTRLRSALLGASAEAGRRSAALEGLARRCEELALMDFTMLYDPARQLFSIGYNATQHRLDPNYYDLLASEARVASFVAVALGQVPQANWFTMGRLLTTVNGRPILVSWSGAMFEYVMPLLIMPSCDDTLLDASCRAAVERQIDYGRQLGRPWGISESGYNFTDAGSNYQYRAFGVPGLGLKRGLAEDCVIAPYATVMALAIAPREAVRNLERLQAEGAAGRYGFYEAIDYTPSRVAPGQPHAIVRSFMAHHQGMSLIALVHQLRDRPMQRRFTANPFFKAAEVLLHERVPKEMAPLRPRDLESSRVRESAAAAEGIFRVFTNPNAGAPETHLLSNGRYHVMITSAGGGYSLWHDLALTRWREDPTRDCWGAFIYLRDAGGAQVWSAAYQPTLQTQQDYQAIFSQGRAEFRCRLHGIDAHTEISVSPEDDVEVRRVTLTNQSNEVRSIEVTSYAEVALNTIAADQAHPAFSKLFVQTQILPARHALLCSRRPRARGEQPPAMFHLMLADGEESAEPSFESDRAQFLGRGRSAASPAALERPGALSNREGAVLDPAVAVRRTLRLGPRACVHVTVVTGIAATREAVLALVEKYQDQSMADRVFELAWTHGMVTLRQLNATEPQAQLYGRLAGAVLYTQPARRAPAGLLAQNRRGQRHLWSFGLSGDTPIVLVRSSLPDGLELIRDLLHAHAYWRLKGLAVDLVILDEHDSTYRQTMHHQIMALVASGLESHMVDKPGGIFVRSADQLSPEDKLLLQSVARVVLSDRAGTLAEQMQRKTRPEPNPPANFPARKRALASEKPAELPRLDLMFDNGRGGFTRDGREYVIRLPPDQTTPAPWVNVMGNPGFGTLISESGSSYTWAENSHEFRLTPWHNDPVTDPSGEAFYIRDEQSGRFWSPAPRPARGQTAYLVRHGFGYSVFEHREDGLVSELWVFVAADAPVKFVRLILRNISGRARQLSVTGYWEWVLGELRSSNHAHVVTDYDARTGALLARNVYNTDFTDRVAFVTASEVGQSHTGDRAEFIGRNNTLAMPSALGRLRLSGRQGAGLDRCAAIRVPLQLAPGEEREVVFKLGAGQDLEQTNRLLQTYRGVGSCHAALRLTQATWENLLRAVRIETPEPAVDVLANGWLLYQVLSCRMWGRTGFYQSGGAYGFRDQLQDAMSLVHARPDVLREHLLRAAAHQFAEGDVQHWWHPPSDRGVRARFADDSLWLAYATCRYVESLGDTGVLDESTPFLAGRPLRADEESYFDAPQRAAESGTLYEHCVRAIRNGLKFGEQGLPLIGSGDWNDGLNRVGEHGKGESVWAAFFLCDVLRKFAPLARARGDAAFAQSCLEQAQLLQEHLEKNAWDGEWYRRAYFDNGEPLGSAANPECQIDALPQSWAVLSGASDPKRARTAMEAVARRLVRRDAGLIQLFDPPFDKSPADPGYIKGYVPGVRENGGQYTHAAIWTVMAFAGLGDPERAWELCCLLNPVEQAGTPAGCARYRVEPYVMAGDVYSVAPYEGRGGWTWYTGSAGWMYRLILETFLGFRLEGDTLRFNPHLPSAWRTFHVHYRYRETPYHIAFTSPSGRWEKGPRVVVDGVEQAEPVIRLRGDHAQHKVEVTFG